MCIAIGQHEKVTKVLNMLRHLGLCDALEDVMVYAWDGLHHYVNERVKALVDTPLFVIMSLFQHLTTSGEIVVLRFRAGGYAWVDAKLYLYSLPVLAYSEFQDSDGTHYYYVNEIGGNRIAGTDLNVVGAGLTSLELRLTNYMSYFDKIQKVKELLSHVPSDVRSDPKKTWIKPEL